jgi:ABC-2 type transport system permease protein
MRRFLVLLKKELRELLTPQILVPILISAIVFVFIGDVVGAEQEKAEETRAVAVVDLDESATSEAIEDALEAGGFAVTSLEPGAGDVEAAVEDSPEKMTFVIPEGFESSLSSGDILPVQAFSRIDSFSFVGVQDTGAVRAIVDSVNGFVSDRLIAEAAPGADPERLKRPVRLEEHVMVGERSVPGAPELVEGFVIQQTVFVPMILFVVIMLSAQMIATTVTAEKENKTLETLLASPVSRGALVTAKMMAASIVALLVAVAYMFAMGRYMSGISGGQISAQAGGDLIATLGLTLDAGDYLLVGVTLFLGILCALSIALILGAFAESVRSIGAVMAPLLVMLIVPYLLTSFLDFNTLSPALKAVVMAIPFSYPFIAMPSLMLGNETIVYWGIVYEAIWFGLFALLAARIFGSDRILTMRLKFGRLRRSDVSA